MRGWGCERGIGLWGWGRWLGLALLASVNSSAALDVDPVAHWTFDEGSGDRVSDISGNSHDGQLVEGPVWFSDGGKGGGALTFYGEGEYVSLPGVLAGATMLTVTGWVMPEKGTHTFMKANDSAIRFWLDTRRDGEKPKVRNGVQLIASDGEASRFLRYENEALRAGRWSHVATTWDGAVMKLYANGVLQDQADFDPENGAGLRPMTELGLGQLSNSNAPWLEGMVDDVRIYDRALTADQILEVMADVPEEPALPNPHAITTFESIGLYWSPPGGGPELEAQVRYRPASGGAWREAQSLWFDDRESQQEYRGSIVHAQPAITYEVELSIPGLGERDTVWATTWSEDFPVAEVVTLPEYSTETLELTRSGTPEGYILYQPQEGLSATIDAGDSLYSCIDVRASYVIIRGVTCVGGERYGIQLLPGAHDVVIEECDVSGWGRDTGGGHEANYPAIDGGIHGTSWFVYRIVAQRNRLHHPRANSCTWEVYHPYGPLAISLDSGGNNVFRYNDAFSDDDHYFSDVLGGGVQRVYPGDPLNNSRGFPGADSDVYGNALSHCWDDGIESEGSNRNARVWGNFIDRAFCHIAIAPVELGPLYVWRNISSVGGRAVGDSSSAFLKTDCEEPYGCGRAYIYHNTVLQPPETGANVGLGWASAPSEMVSRNNILDNPRSDGLPGTSIYDHAESERNDYDFDLCSGRYPEGSEPNGIDGEPIYGAGSPTFDVRDSGEGNFVQAETSLAYDAATPLPNFNGDYHGNGPDMGAHEAGDPPMQFGMDAYRKGEMAGLTVYVDGVPACVASNEELVFEAGVRNQNAQPASFDQADFLVVSPIDWSTPLYSGAPFEVVSGQEISTWVRLPVPSGALPGIYSLAVSISLSGEEVSRADFAVEVLQSCP